MVSVAIVDDSSKDIEVLETYLKKYGAENGTDFDITVFREAISFLEGYNAKFDLIFMDVSMPYFNGFQAAKKLREMDEEVALVFVTTLEKYAIKGYEVSALDYLVKPLEYRAFSIKLRRILRMTEKRGEDSIVIDFGKEHRRIAVKDIRYLESEKHTICVHLSDGTDLLTRQTLGTFETQLQTQGYPFIRTSNSFLVNPRHIAKIKESTVYLRDDTEVPIARPRKNEVMNQFAQFMGGSRD